jgi:hypothetical protein
MLCLFITYYVVVTNNESQYNDHCILRISYLTILRILEVQKSKEISQIMTIQGLWRLLKGTRDTKTGLPRSDTSSRY